MKNAKNFLTNKNKFTSIIKGGVFYGKKNL